MIIGIKNILGLVPLNFDVTAIFGGHPSSRSALTLYTLNFGTHTFLSRKDFGAGARFYVTLFIPGKYKVFRYR